MSDRIRNTLRDARQRSGLSQDQVAKLMHVTRQTISNWETGRTEPDIDSLRSLSAYIDMDDMLGRDDAALHASNEGAGRYAHRGRRLLCVLALIGLMIAAAFLLRPGRAVDLSISDYGQAEQAVPGQAHLNLFSRENPLYCAPTQSGAQSYWYYRVFMREDNGVGFSVESVLMVYHERNGGNRADELYSTANSDRYGNMDIGEYSIRILSGSIAYNPDYEGVGFLINGTDANGHALSFKYYLALR